MFGKKFRRVVRVEQSEADFKERMQDVKLEKNDPLAMVIAGLITFLPAVLVPILIFIAVIWLFFLRG